MEVSRPPYRLKVNSHLVNRVHIFTDLLPYVCTNGIQSRACSEEFTSRSAWVRHETLHLVLGTTHVKCPFCVTTKAALPMGRYFKHVARHLQEISLAVIPQSNDSQSESESDSASSQLSDAPNLIVPGFGGRSVSPAKIPTNSQDVPTETARAESRDIALDLESLNLNPSAEASKVEARAAGPLIEVTSGREHIPTARTVDKKAASVPGAAALELPSASAPKIQPCRYKTGKTLGAGSYSVVKECVHIETGRYYAAKVINKRLMMGREHMVSRTLHDPPRVSPHLLVVCFMVSDGLVDVLSTLHFGHRNRSKSDNKRYRDPSEPLKPFILSEL